MSELEYNPYSVNKTIIWLTDRGAETECYVVEGTDDTGEWRRTYFVGPHADIRAQVYAEEYAKRLNILANRVITYPHE